MLTWSLNYLKERAISMLSGELSDKKLEYKPNAGEEKVIEDFLKRQLKKSEYAAGQITSTGVPGFAGITGPNPEVDSQDYKQIKMLLGITERVI